MKRIALLLIIFTCLHTSSYAQTYIQNQYTSAQAGDLWITSRIRTTGTNAEIILQKDGSNNIISAFQFRNAAFDRGANLQLTGDATPGLATWVFDGTIWNERMRILSTGNIGIGTTAPAYKLEVNGTTNFSGIMRTPASLRVVKDGSASSQESIALYNAAQTRGANIQLGATPNPTLDFWSTSAAGIWTKRAYFDSIGNYIVIGNTGIGQSSPAYKLDVNGTGNFNGIVRSSASFRVIKDGSNTSLETIAMYNTAQTRGANIQLGATPNPALKFFSTNPSGVYTERMTIDSAGNTGIGTSAPAYKLEVNGTGNFSGTLRTTGDITAVNGSRLKSTSGTGVSTIGAAAVSMFSTGTNANAGYSAIQTAYDGITYESPLVLQYQGGSVGIGTSNPGTYKLAVEGTIGARKIKVTQGTWADYVFDSSYQLTPLHQVEKYIQANKHLPDMPSATTVKSEGLDLGDNQALLLKKLEELTLYIIEQDKTIKEMKQEIKELKASK